MKKLLVLFSILVSSTGFAQLSCNDILKDSALHLEQMQSLRLSHVNSLKQLGLEETSYVTRWKVTADQFAGPLAKSGEMFATIVPKEKIASWLETIGEESIGFMVIAYPHFKNQALHSGGTSYLRVGKKIYSFDFTEMNLNPTNAQFVEVTIPMQRDEINSIEEFVNLRTKLLVLAKSQIKSKDRTFEVGDRILPVFDETRMGLIKEGCAGKCSSFTNADWWAHLPQELATRLKAITDKYELFPSPVARQLIWRNSRNPHALGLTVFNGLRWSGDTNHKTFVTPMIEKFHWGNLRGMYIYGTVPDPVGKSKTIESQRLTLDQWLQEKNER